MPAPKRIKNKRKVNVVDEKNLPHEDEHQHQPKVVPKAEVALESVAEPKVKPLTINKVHPKPKRKHEVPNPGFELRNNCIVHISKNKQGEEIVEFVARRTEIVKILININTEEVLLEVSFEYMGKSYTQYLKREYLTCQGLLTLAKYGADINEIKVRGVLKFLDNQEALAPTAYVHSHVGWVSFREKQIFCLQEAIGMTSTYDGQLNIAPKGNLETWKKIIASEVIGNTPLEMALTFGFSASVLPLIREKTGLDLLLIHLYGDSTTGKTTAVRVATAPFGYPNTMDNGLIRTWNGTPNAIIGHFKNNFGIPMALDEASMSTNDIFTRLIYMLAAGKDKDRLKKNGEARETSTWSTTILSTAEKSLHGSANRNTGLRMRLFEFGNIQWTKSAENADALKEGLLANYGYAGIKFVQYLMTLQVDEIVERWKVWCQTCLEAMETTDTFSKRMADRVAVIMLTVELVNESLHLNLNVDTIHELLQEMNEQSTEHRDIGEEAYNYLIEKFQQYEQNFYCKQRNSNEKDSTLRFSKENWGKYVLEKETIKEIHILPDKLREILSSGGFEDIEVVLNSWVQKKLLIFDKGRRQTKRTIRPGGMRVWVYCIKVKDGNISPRPTSQVQVSVSHNNLGL